MSKSNITFNVELRERTGTGGSRAARREGLVQAFSMAAAKIRLRSP